jgi:hypothetical protein
MIKILYFSDPMDTFCGDTVEQEVKYCKKWLKDFIFENKKFKFESTFDSLKIVEDRYDILIFDFGGIGFGCTDLAYSLSREILKLIEDRPNTLFVAWTYFTNDYLKGECEKELGDFPNLICRDTDNEPVIKGILKWLDIGDKK